MATPSSGTSAERPAGGGGGAGRSSDRGPRRGGPSAPGGGGRKQYFRRRKVCKFCDEKIDFIDYKDVRMVSQFVSDRGKILPRRLTGTCSPHQRLLTVAIKRARNLAFIPFAAGT
jgi:small subunit ribosomal protein S18